MDVNILPWAFCGDKFPYAMSAFAVHLPLQRGRSPVRASCVRASATGRRAPSADGALSRRAALFTLCGTVGGALFPQAGSAMEEVSSEQYGYSFVSPGKGWTRSSASLSGARTLTAFTRDGDMTGATNVSMVETPVAGDFMKLTSFGPLESVLKTLVPDGQGEVSGDIIEARQDTSKNAYVIEYRLKAGRDAPMRHLVTVFSLQPGRYLLTLTAQTTEDQWEKEAKVLKEVAESFKLRLLD